MAARPEQDSQGYTLQLLYMQKLYRWSIQSMLLGQWHPRCKGLTLVLACSISRFAPLALSTLGMVHLENCLPIRLDLLIHVLALAALHNYEIMRNWR